MLFSESQRNVGGLNPTGSIEGKGKPWKLVLIASVFSDITFTFEFYSM